MKIFYFVMALIAAFSLYTNLFTDHGLVLSVKNAGGFDHFFSLIENNGAFRSSLVHWVYALVAGGYFLFRFVKSEWR